MNHEQDREKLPLYADGELDPQQARELEAHLAASAELRAELERWRALRRCAHRVLTAPLVPAELEDTVRDAVRRRQIAGRGRPLRWFGGVTAIAAAIVLAFVLWRPDSSLAGPKLLAADSFAEIYLHCAVEHRHRGVDVDRGDMSAVRAKLASLKTHPVLVPDLRNRGFELDGVCNCFHVPGVEVVHVFYRRRAPEPTVVSFFSMDQKIGLKDCTCEACRISGGQQRDYEIAKCKCEGMMVCKWDEARNSFAVCSEMTHAQLRDLADGIKVTSLQESLGVFAWAEP